MSEARARRSLEALDLSPGATEEELRQAYRERVVVWHPDRLPERLRALGTRKVQSLNEAWAFLSSDAGREALAALSTETERSGRAPSRHASAGLSVVEAACNRCEGRGAVFEGLSAQGHILSGQCPLCLGRGTLVCVEGSRCRECGGDGRAPSAKGLTRAGYVRSRLGAVKPGTGFYRIRYRRLVLEYETEVAPCRTCRGAGYTFFKPDARARGPEAVGPRDDRRGAGRGSSA